MRPKGEYIPEQDSFGVCSNQAITFLALQKLGDTNEIWNMLDGIFACVLVDEAKGEFIAARDPIGVCSFYWGRGKDGSTWFASEMKALQAHCETFDIFPPVSVPIFVLHTPPHQQPAGTLLSHAALLTFQSVNGLLTYNIPCPGLWLNNQSHAFPKVDQVQADDGFQGWLRERRGMCTEAGPASLSGGTTRSG